ncbi:alpha- and gamma-adaptin-binding protein p34-like [Leptopilina heterotoma]|uniref:alpha- and gamma-adaptin-binding protein p34-like n=1 Tax=Leptopilina heterotoma TaxID=63436 RepID=UPI001CAA0D5A|nr:alpha- and gamma-adaptin-binding protein p34-like [Leptopilina heterotoma]
MYQSVIEKNLPRALIINDVKNKTIDLAKLIGAEPLSKEDGMEYYLWNIDNKYYTAQVLISSTQNSLTNILFDGVEALIVYHEPNEEQTLCYLENWKSLMPSLAEVEILLFVCNSIKDSSLKEKLTEWCMQQKFELVELEQGDMKETDDSESGRNAYGIERIIEALQAHTWTNMILKNQTSETKSREEVNRVGEQIENIQLDAQPDISDRLRMESVFDGIMDSENVDFGELYGQLMAMKEHAATLPTNQRKLAAEQLVTAFWKAMGGDPAEISDLD